jgi:hypothetical protein
VPLLLSFVQRFADGGNGRVAGAVRWPLPGYSEPLATAIGRSAGVVVGI